MQMEIAAAISVPYVPGERLREEVMFRAGTIGIG